MFGVASCSADMSPAGALFAASFPRYTAAPHSGICINVSPVFFPCCLIEKCYRKISTWGHPSPAPFPVFHRDPAALLRTRRRPATKKVFGLSESQIARRVKAIAKAAGFADWELFSGHSGRVGMARRMAQNGAPPTRSNARAAGNRAAAWSVATPAVNPPDPRYGICRRGSYAALDIFQQARQKCH